MVKGTNRRVIVVRSPDPKLFEEAIFVLREEGGTRQDAGLVLEQAAKAAGDYLKSCGVTTIKKRRRGVWYALAAVGLALAGLGTAFWFFFV